MTDTAGVPRADGTQLNSHSVSLPTVQEIGWDRGRPPATRWRRAVLFWLSAFSSSPCALIAGGTPAVPANHLSVYPRLRCVLPTPAFSC